MLVNFKLVRQIKEKNVSTFSFYLLAWRFPRLLYLSLVYINSLTHHSSSACGRNFVEQIWSNEFALRCCLTLVAKRTSLFKSDILPIFYQRLRWHVSNWQACTKTCGRGNQSRSVVCRARVTDTDYQIEFDEVCNATKKPIETRFCNEINCPASRTTHWTKVWHDFTFYTNGTLGLSSCPTVFSTKQWAIF